MSFPHSDTCSEFGNLHGRGTRRGPHPRAPQAPPSPTSSGSPGPVAADLVFQVQPAAWRSFPRSSPERGCAHWALYLAPSSQPDATIVLNKFHPDLQCAPCTAHCLGFTYCVPVRIIKTHRPQSILECLLESGFTEVKLSRSQIRPFECVVPGVLTSADICLTRITRHGMVPSPQTPRCPSLAACFPQHAPAFPRTSRRCTRARQLCESGVVRWVLVRPTLGVDSVNTH